MPQQNVNRLRLGISATAAILALTLAGCGLIHHNNQTTATGPAPPYWVTDLRPLDGGKTSQAFDLNDRGDVVGRTDFGGSHGHAHAVIWESDKSPRDLGTLDGNGSEADRISPGGRIAGWSSFIGKHIHAVTFGGDKPTDIGTLSGTMSLAFGIDDTGRTLVTADTPTGAVHSYVLSDSPPVDLGTLSGYRDAAASYLASDGAVVGTSDNGGGGKLAFRWLGGAMQPLPPLRGYTNSYANRANGGGEVVGSCSDGPVKFRAVAWSNEAPIGLGPESGKESEALAVNDAGVVVGQCNNHACLWRHGKLIDLNTMIGKHSGTVLHTAVAINNRGQIACNGTVNNETHAYLLTPSDIASPTPGA
jgi:uncharacterized membrane protein